MRLVAIEQASFGVLNIPSPLEFDRGLTVLAGHNQAGKSSMFTLVEWLLYGVPARGGTQRNQVLCAEWAPWGGGEPRASALFATELRGWPERIRVEANFSDFRLRISDAGTLEDLTAKVNLHKSGEWDLGEKLTGLKRHALLGSLLARQGELEGVLGDHDHSRRLRSLLTADLAELVEDPERATLDGALEQLKKPLFTCGELSKAPVQMEHMQRQAQKARDDAVAQCAVTATEYETLSQLLGERENAEFELAGQQRKLNEQRTLSADLELAVASYYIRRAGEARAQLAQWDARAAENPHLRDFPSTLVADLERWQGESAALEDELNRRQSRASRTSGTIEALELRIRRIEEREGIAAAELQAQVTALPKLQQAASEIAAARKDEAEAETWVRKYGESADPATRTRFEQAYQRLLRSGGALPQIWSWYDKRGQLASKRRVLEERLAGLRAIATPVPAALIGGVVLLVAAIAAIALPLLPTLGIRALVALALAALGTYLTSQGATQRKVALRSQSELAAAQQQLAELSGAQKLLDGDEAQLRSLAGADDARWAEILADLPVYVELQPTLGEYSRAVANRDAARERAAAAWEPVSAVCKDAPYAPDAKWLDSRLTLLDGLAETIRDRDNSAAASRDEKLEVERTQRDVQAKLERLAQLLTPLGLSELALSDPPEAIRRANALAGEAGQQAKAWEASVAADKAVAALSMREDEFHSKWNGLSESRREKLAAAVSTEAGCRELEERRRKTTADERALDEQLEGKRQRVRLLREEAAKYEDAPQRLADAQAAQRDAEEQLALVQRWDRALKLVREQLAALAGELGGNLAPAINAHLAEMLAESPVDGVLEARVNNELELNLRVAGAPTGLAGPALLARMSTGARRQLALALRIAVAEALGSAHTAPLLLDEPLVELDDACAVDVLRYLDGLARGRQVILSTCHHAHHRWLLAQAGVQARVVELSARVPLAAGASV